MGKPAYLPPYEYQLAFRYKVEIDGFPVKADVVRVKKPKLIREASEFHENNTEPPIKLIGKKKFDGKLEIDFLRIAPEDKIFLEKLWKEEPPRPVLVKVIDMDWFGKTPVNVVVYKAYLVGFDVEEYSAGDKEKVLVNKTEWEVVDIVG